MFGWIKFIVKSFIFLAIIAGAVLGYRYYSIYVPYSDFVYNHLYFDEVKSIYAGKCANIAYKRALYNKSMNSPITYEDIVITPYVSFGRWMSDNRRTEIGQEMEKILPENSWHDFVEANKTTYVKYVGVDGSIYKMQFVVTEPGNAYTEKLEFDGPINDYYGLASDMVRGWAEDAFDIRSQRGPDVPRNN